MYIAVIIVADREAPSFPDVKILRCYFISLQYRRQIKKFAANKYENRLEKKVAYEETRPKESYKLNPVDEIFSGDTMEKASEIQTQVTERKVKENETPVSKNSPAKMKKRDSRKLKDPNKQNEKQKQKKTGKKLKQKKTLKQHKKFKKLKGTNKKRKGFVNQRAAFVEM
jgi:hypothetical protein